MMHLNYEEALATEATKQKAEPLTPSRVRRAIREGKAIRTRNNVEMASHAARELGTRFWTAQPPLSPFARAEDDIFIRVLRGIAGAEPVKLATSRLNRGAISNLPDDVVCEYSQVLRGQEISPVARHAVPMVVQGITNGLAIHQTMLGDACATGDPKLLAHALLAYPMRSFSKAARNLFRELLVLNQEEISPSLRKTTDYL